MSVQPLRAKAIEDVAAVLMQLAPRHRGLILSAIRQYGTVAAIPPQFWDELARDIEAAEKAKIDAAVLLLIVASYEDTENRLRVDNMPQNRIRNAAVGISTTLTQSAAQRWAQGARDILLREIDDKLAEIEALAKTRQAEALKEAIRKATSDDRAEAIATDLSVSASTRGQRGAAGDIEVRQSVTLRQRWKTRPDKSETGPCPICAPLDGTYEDIWGVVAPNGPDPQNGSPHYRCVCELEFVPTAEPAGV